MSKVLIGYPFWKSHFETKLDEQIEIFDAKKHLDNLATVNLIIFSGGEDINPGFYSQSNRFSTGINSKRDSIEADAFSVISRYNYGNISRSSNNNHIIKILGVCRGHQLINVLLGGSLYQDIYLETGIDHKYEHILERKIETSAVNFFSYVNSMHHQAVQQVGRGLQITSFCNDIIESTENNNIITTQFHPEVMLGEETDKFWNYIKVWAKLSDNPKQKKTEKFSEVFLNPRNIKEDRSW